MKMPRKQPTTVPNRSCQETASFQMLYHISIHVFIYLYGPPSGGPPIPRRDGDGPYMYIDI